MLSIGGRTTGKGGMINYTERLARLMQDVIGRVPALSFIDMAEVLVFARSGRSSADGPFATCHCLTLPPSEEGYYFWRDRSTGAITRRSEWFVTKSPTVTVNERAVKYMLSFTLPRFADQSLERSRKEKFYTGAEPWLAKLDTVIHELYHIDPEQRGIRRIEREDGALSVNCHGHRFFAQVAEMVGGYLRTKPDPALYDFLKADFATLESRYGGVAATTFRTFPSFPQRYIESAPVQRGCEADAVGVIVEPLSLVRQPTHYTEQDLHVRRFGARTAQRVRPNTKSRAA